MLSGSWHVAVRYNFEIQNWHVGSHFYFWDPNELDGRPPAPYFASPHLNILKQNEATRAFARAQSLLKLANGLRIITEGVPVYSENDLFYENSNYFQRIFNKKDPMIMLEELHNPFDSIVVEEIRENNVNHQPNIYQDYIELMIEDEVIRETVLLLSLSMENDLYLLINAYKILENIRNDEEMKLELKKKKFRGSHLPEGITYDFIQKLQDLTGHINNRSSSGILSRHGNDNKDDKLSAPSYNEILDIVIIAISEWMRFKCYVRFERLYDRSKGLHPVIKGSDFFDDL